MTEASFADLEPATGTAGACAALGRSRATLYRHRGGPLLGPRRPRPVLDNALSGVEQDSILATLHQARFVDRAPAQIWATLLDEGTYLGSEITMYRILRSVDEVRERRAIAS